ncbi:MAG TPA: glycoside hydrolase family 127 protein [Candidatus Aminicenantes bacterium]|nr:glycoside hydrolase family 127 protein [Candidatus Aminicenantes bacterium]HRY63830.1 glycoside hydrolase family 127 protein [Candidatus Aminicenantes bacterium]HRZ70743.1 glycoside hydrolase family 127 protein [Candidatus Aminicenantes bacterium]
MRSPDRFPRPAVLALVLLLAGGLASAACRGRSAAPGAAAPDRDYPIRPVAFTEVRLTDAFWAPRLETNRTVSVPYALRLIEETGRVDNFRKAAHLMTGPTIGRRFNDSDVFKAMEAAAYTLRLHPDPALEKTLDDLVALIGRAQEPDGYLYTTRTADPARPAAGAGPERWSNLRVSHELYNVGHMYEAAVAHFQATGKRTFLAIAEKNAGLLLRTFGTGPGQRHGFPGHQEIEIGLAKLYRATGNSAYLDLARFFLDERGRYFGGERHAPGDPFALYDSDEYLQNHRPVLEQDQAVGHAVRAMYMYSGLADVAALGGYPGYVAAIDRLWLDVAGRKQYLTGGIGARSGSEAFGDAYELPNAEAYAETCAAIGNALWNYRLFLLHGESKYMDVFERVLYNGLLSGVSLSGDRFFYQNPLESAGGYQRSPWFEVSCCPPNMTRFLPSLPGYVYATRDDVVFVNLFIAGSGRVALPGRTVVLTQETRYPWDGTVVMTVAPDRPGPFELAVRIPGWARGQAMPAGLYRFLDAGAGEPVLKVDGQTVALDLSDGYARIRREWKTGETIELALPMPVRRVVAADAVAEDAGRVALQRGPVVFSVEGVDNGDRVFDLVLGDGVPLSAGFRPDLLDGVVVISGEAAAVSKTAAGKTVESPRPFLAIPYYAWANRGGGQMLVWLPRTSAAVRPPKRLDMKVD